MHTLDDQFDNSFASPFNSDEDQYVISTGIPTHPREWNEAIFGNYLIGYGNELSASAFSDGDVCMLCLGAISDVHSPDNSEDEISNKLFAFLKQSEKIFLEELDNHTKFHFIMYTRRPNETFAIADLSFSRPAYSHSGDHFAIASQSEILESNMPRRDTAGQPMVVHNFEQRTKLHLETGNAYRW